jgi:hypothetical protein
VVLSEDFYAPRQFNPNKIMQAHVSLAFAQQPAALLPDFTTGVVNGLTKNITTFVTPPVLPVALDAVNKNLISAVAAAVGGGRAQTDARDVAAGVVIGMLRQLAAYVEDIAKGSEAVITLSGFQYVERGFSPQQPLIKTTILAIINEISGGLLLRLNPQDNAFGYEGKMSVDGGKTYQPISTFPQARRVVVPNLTPGTTYTFIFRALGGSTGSGDWSDPVSHMAT